MSLRSGYNLVLYLLFHSFPFLECIPGKRKEKRRHPGWRFREHLFASTREPAMPRFMDSRWKVPGSRIHIIGYCRFSSNNRVTPSAQRAWRKKAPVVAVILSLSAQAWNNLWLTARSLFSLLFSGERSKGSSLRPGAHFLLISSLTCRFKKGKEILPA